VLFTLLYGYYITCKYVKYVFTGNKNIFITWKYVLYIITGNIIAVICVYLTFLPPRSPKTNNLSKIIWIYLGSQSQVSIARL